MGKKIIILKSQGQAMIEYLLLLMFVVGLSVKLVGTFSDFFRDSLGNLGHVLTLNLTIGVCKDNCFFPGYVNSPQK